MKSIVRGISWGLFILAVAMVISSCSGGAKNHSEEGKPVKLLDAKGFAITQFDGYKLLDVVDPWKPSKLLHRYILIDRDKPKPSDLPKGDIVRVPVQSTACLYSVFVGSLDMLGALPTVNSVAEERYIDNEVLKDRIAKGSVKLLGEASAVNVEALISSNPEIILASPFKNMGYGRMEKTGIPIVEVASYMESTPLARSEWIKFFGVLYGKEHVADSIYNALRDRYNSVKKVADGVTSRPTLFVDKKFGQVWNMPGGGSYMARFFSDAGAKYLWDDTSEGGSVKLSFESVYQKAEHADFWVIRYNKPQDMTYSDLRHEYEPYSLFKAFKQKNIIYCNTNKVSYYEEGIMEPDVILADLVKLLHPDKLPNHKLVYFQRMK